MMRRIWRQRRGATLVELVVSFVLLALFCVGFIYMIAASMQLHRVVIGEMRGQVISDTLLEKIVGEIGGAQGGVKSEYTLNVMRASTIPVGTEDNYLQDGDRHLLPDNSVIAFCSRDGTPLYMLAEDGKLLIHYRPVKDESKQMLDAVDYKLDDAVYQGFRITSLSFSLVPIDGKRTNVVRVDLTVEDDSGYRVVSSRYVECVHFTETEVSKIEYKGIQTDAAYAADHAET